MVTGFDQRNKKVMVMVILFVSMLSQCDTSIFRCKLHLSVSSTFFFVGVSVLLMPFTN